MLALALLVSFGTSATAENASIAHGRALYRGEAPSAGEASILGMSTPLARLPCAGCHGQDAEGGTEGSRPAPALRLDRLVARSAAYADPGALAETLRTGVTPDGRTLAPTMPQFTLNATGIAALYRWLGAVSGEERLGFGPDAIHLKVRGGDTLRMALRFELDRLIPNGLWGLPIVLEGVSDPDMRREEEAQLTAITAGDAHNETDECFAAIGGAVPGCSITLFPAGGLIGDEPPDIRGLWASRADQVRALMRSVEGGVILTGEGPEMRRLLHLLSKEVSPDGGEDEAAWRVASSIERPPIRAENVLLLCGPDELPNMLARLVDQPHLLALRATIEPWKKILLEHGVSFTLADPLPGRDDPGQGNVGIVPAAAAVLVAAFRACGGDCTRSRFIETFDTLELQPADWHALNYLHHHRTGTDQVSVIHSP